MNKVITTTGAPAAIGPYSQGIDTGSLVFVAGQIGREAQQQIRQQHPRLGGLLLALSNEPTSTRVWAQGAAGERAVAAKLDALVGEHVAALLDRRLRRRDGSLSKANIDHIAVTPSGVWVIDAKTHQGSLEVRRSGGLFSPRVEALYINGRDQTRLVHGLLKQVDAVRHELSAVEASIAVAPGLSVTDAHAIATEAQHRLLHQIPGLAGATVHVSPDGPA